MESFDVAVIGGGPGGYVAAIRAAQLGMKVALIEKDKCLGGTCLNVGCIPSKALLHSTEMLSWVKSKGEEHGLRANSLTFDFSQMMRRKEKVVKSLTDGVAGLMKRNQIKCFTAEAQILTPKLIVAGEQKIQTDKIIIATGSIPIELPFLPFDEKKILSSTGILSLKEVPKRLLVIGAGVIGLELGSVYNRLGSSVTFVEMMESVCFGMDGTITKLLNSILTKQGMKFLFKARVIKGEANEKGVKLSVEHQGKLQEIEGDLVLVAVGRKAYTKGLGLENVGIEVKDKGMIEVDGNFKTSIENIYAIGDVIDGPMLAHKASEEGVALAEKIAGLQPHLDYMGIPSVIYTSPEVASVGLTEEECRHQGLDFVVGGYPFRANARARSAGEEEGIVKLIGERKAGRLLGMHLVGAHASEMIHEGVLAIEKKMTVEEIARACHAHPTLSEAIKEAALNFLGRCLHL